MSRCLDSGLRRPSRFAGQQHNSPALIIHAYMVQPSCIVRLGRISNLGWS